MNSQQFRVDHLLMAPIRAWDRFWFTPADPSVLGLIRLCCGLLVLYIHIAYTGDLHEFFGRHAWLDPAAINDFRHEFPWYTPATEFNAPLSPPSEKGYVAWSVWYSITDPTAVAIVHGAVLLVMLLFAIGYCTRVMSVLTWLAAISYIQRSPTGLFGMDTMMNLLLIYLMIGPSGAAWSLDALLARRRKAKSRLVGGHDALTDGPPKSISANLALRLIQVNLCMIYLAAGLSKLLGQTWWNGTAVWYTADNPEFSPLHLAAYSSLLRWLCGHRWLWEISMSGGVVFTFFVEIGFPSLVWNRHTRWFMIASAIAMHTGIALTMGLATFSLMMVFMDMAFLPPGLLRFRRLGSASDKGAGAGAALAPPSQGGMKAAHPVRHGHGFPR